MVCLSDEKIRDRFSFADSCAKSGSRYCSAIRECIVFAEKSGRAPHFPAVITHRCANLDRFGDVPGQHVAAPQCLGTVLIRQRRHRTPTDRAQSRRRLRIVAKR